jgi:ATP-dependent Clp protease, protease subunit
MAKEKVNNEIYLMAPMFDETALEYCKTLDCIPKDEDVTTLLNCPGGSVFAGWTIIGKMKERTGKNNAKVYGHAASMAMYFLLYCDNVEALEVTRFLIHRADGYVRDENDQKFLDGINADLKTHMKNKLNDEVLKKQTGYSLKDIFDSENVLDVWITAKQAKKIGLINSVIRMSPEETTAFNRKFVAMAEGLQGSDLVQGSTKPLENNNNLPKIDKKMTKAEFKAQNPELYAEILAEGEATGIKSEQTRVKNWIAYLDYDKENVIASIKGGKEFTSDVTSEMIVKMQAS